MKKNINGFLKWFFVSLAVAGIIWNAAVLHNEVYHLKNSIQKIEKTLQDNRDDIKFIKKYLLEKTF